MNNFTEKAKWIGFSDGVGNAPTGYESPAIRLRTAFTLDTIPTHAECLISGMGLYVLYINGRRVGDDVLSPAFTAYDKRVLFVRYDVTDYLSIGENTVAVKLGDGFFNQTVRDVWSFYTAPWRTTPRLLFELFADGSSILCSDTSWRADNAGPTYHNSIRGGEYYDAQRADGWEKIGYLDTGWPFAKLVQPVCGILTEQIMPPIRECVILTPIDIWSVDDGYVVDFGKNIAGYVGINMSAERGSTLVIRYGEVLTGDGRVDQSQISRHVTCDAFSTDKYTFAGVGRESWHPDLVYHGFRYVHLSGDALTAMPTPDNLCAYFVHTDLARKGNFASSDALLSWIYDSGIRSFLSNFHGFSEDCPHREKNGWTGDAAISADYAVCTFDMKEAYKKWLTDICDVQRPNGQLPGIVPTGGWGYSWGSGPAWDYVIFALPYALYRETGDLECASLVYPYAKKYLDYARYYEQDGLVQFGISDWCFPRNIGDLKLAPGELSDSCYYRASLGIMSELALALGNTSDAAVYRSESQRIKVAIRAKYLDTGALYEAGQGYLAMLLYFKIADGDEACGIAARLARMMEADAYVHKVGILGMKALLNALSEYGYTDVAYRSVARYDYPSYGYWRELGYTTLGEDFEGKLSRNHHMYGDVLNWMFRNIAGLKNTSVAYRTVEIQPYFYADVCSASATTETPRGRISVSWERRGSELTLDLTIPDGTDATLILPSRDPISVTSGKHAFTL